MSCSKCTIEKAYAALQAKQKRLEEEKKRQEEAAVKAPVTARPVVEETKPAAQTAQNTEEVEEEKKETKTKHRLFGR